MKKLLALVFLIAAAAGGSSTSLAFNGMQGGGHSGGFHGNAGPRQSGGFHGGVAVRPFPAFSHFPVHHGFPFRRSFVVVGAGFPVAYYGYTYPAAFVSPPVYLYCQNPMGYYPQIQICPSGWVQVTQ